MRQAILGMETGRSAVAALVEALGAKDANTERHSQRLAGLAARLGTRLGLATDEREALEFGAVLHDIGKIGIPDAILRKPGDLSKGERACLRRHSEIGAEICRPLGISDKLIPIIRHHHERWDGTGYPDGLRGDAAPLGARVVAVLDAYDAMTHDRPYRPAFSPERAMAEIRAHAGRQFDPDIAAMFETEILSTASGPPAPVFADVGASPHVSPFEQAAKPWQAASR
jgi:putative two-component system response regulator